MSLQIKEKGMKLKDCKESTVELASSVETQYINLTEQVLSNSASVLSNQFQHSESRASKKPSFYLFPLTVWIVISSANLISNPKT